MTAADQRPGPLRMTGPQCYSEALRLVVMSHSTPANHDETDPAAALMLQEAQVFATLALAAATALNDNDGDMSVANHDAWSDLAGEQK